MLLSIAHSCFNLPRGVIMSYFRLSQSRNNRIYYYLSGHLRRLYPKSLLNLDLDKLQDSIQNFDENDMYGRLDYYCKINDSFLLESSTEKLSEIRLIHGTYSLDMFEYTRFFSPEYRLAYEFGDVTHVPNIPSMVKSRPVVDNDNSILVTNLRTLNDAKKINAICVLDNDKALNILQLSSLIKDSSFVIANDTGPAHMSAHLNAKGLTLFGSHTTAHKVSIERENFKAIQVSDLNKLSANKVFEKIEEKIN